jgi:cholesterol transport system auxiliary component
MRAGLLAVTVSLGLLTACDTLRPLVTPAQQPKYYSLADSVAAVNTAPPQSRADGSTAVTLIVTPPHAAAGFDSPRMMYLRRADQLEYFAHNEWIDTPSRMLAPLIVAAVESRATFRAVVSTPSPAQGEVRLDTEILRLQQEFMNTPGQVRFTLRAYLVENTTRRVIATREFEAVAAAPSEDPRGGVTAAHAAVRSVLAELADFCTRSVTEEWNRGGLRTLPR